MLIVGSLACKINSIQVQHMASKLKPQAADSPQPLQTFQHVALDALVLLVALQQGDGVIVVLAVDLVHFLQLGFEVHKNLPCASRERRG